MLEKLFLQIVNMSYIGSIVIMFILAARMLLNKAPKKYSYILWAVALFRLIVPVSFESILSWIPVNPTPISNDILYTTTPQINMEVLNIDHSISGPLPAADVVTSVNPMQVWIFLGSLLWISGIVVLLIYGLVSLIRIKSQFKNVSCEQDGIYKSDKVETPFVLGLIRPKIYLPDSLSESEKEYILLHERTHIKRFDHIFRLISYLVLCIHWFNPLVWIAFGLSGKDMEMSCDELVISKLGQDIKKDYSQTLLNLATGRKNFRITPLAFGEGDIKGRVKNILNFKQPKFYIVVISLIVLMVAAFGLLSNPKEKSMGINKTDPILDREVSSVPNKHLTPKAFIEEWELDVKESPTKFDILVPEDWHVELGSYPEGLYWGMANVFSKEIGLDLTKIKGKNVEVQVYELTDGLSGEGDNSNYSYPTNVILLVRDNNTVGAWLNFNVNTIGPSINKKSFKAITGLEIHEWINQNGYFSTSSDNDDLSDLSPIEVLDEFFAAINNGDKESALSFIGPYSQLESLTMNKGNNVLYNSEWGYNNSMVYNIVEAETLSYKLLDPESLEEIDKIGDRSKIELALEMHLVWRDEAFNSPNNQAVRFPILMKYSNGWKIESFGTGP